MKDNKLKEKFVGSILGTAVGDALGKPLEGLSRDEIRDKYGKVEEMLDGRYTDDTQMMMGVAESLLECKGFNAQHMANQFVKNYQPSRGYGYGTIKALNAIKANQPPPFDSLGNGSAVRIAPIGLFYFDSSSKQEEVAKESSAITHTHLLAKEGCWLLARAIGMALIEKEKEEIIKELSNVSKPPYKTALQYATSINIESTPLYYPSKMGIDSTILNSLPAAFYSFLFNSNFREALIYSINLGGDTDTLGAMCGALAGAYWGINEIPSNWLDKLEDMEYIKELAEKLFKLKAEL